MRGEAKSFVKAEKRAEIRLACICPFQCFRDIKGKQGCEAGGKKRLNREIKGKMESKFSQREIKRQ